jgi:hypothetical protein
MDERLLEKACDLLQEFLEITDGDDINIQELWNATDDFLRAISYVKELARCPG